MQSTLQLIFAGKELPFAVRDSALVSTDKNGLFLIGGCTNCNPRYGHSYLDTMLVLKNSTSEWKKIKLTSKNSLLKRKRHIAVVVNEKEEMVYGGKLHSLQSSMKNVKKIMSLFRQSRLRFIDLPYDNF